MATENLTPAEITELCTEGDAAWKQLGPRQKKAKFKWRGRSYVAKHTNFRLCIENEAGELVASRWD
jgi:hypothetical protein